VSGRNGGQFIDEELLDRTDGIRATLAGRRNWSLFSRHVVQA
jgi:hypothetical protein